MADSGTATVGARRGVAVVTDSAACLQPDEADRLGVTTVPFTLVLDGEVYDDGALEPADFYRRLRAAKEPPKTAAVAPAAYLEAFRRSGQRQAVCITVSGRFSATHANALIAARDAEREGIAVRVVDAEYAAMAEGYVVLSAARAAQAGGDSDSVAAAAAATIPQVGLVMALESLDYLARGGRVPRVAAWAASLIQVRPLVEFRKREIRLAGRVRTRRRALQALVDLLARRTAGARRLHLTVHHADAPDDAAWLLEAARDRLKPASSALSEFTQVMAAHVGPGLVGYAYWQEE
ncbi:MAG: DegV family protein [bacterium]|nr:DegV family protein [bacterium]